MSWCQYTSNWRQRADRKLEQDNQKLQWGEKKGTESRAEWLLGRHNLHIEWLLGFRGRKKGSVLKGVP